MIATRASLAFLTTLTAFATAASAAAEGGEHHGVDLNAVIVQFLGFAVLALILIVWVVPIIAKALRGRSEGIAKTFTELDERKASAQQAAQDAETGLRDVETWSLERFKEAEASGLHLRNELEREGNTGARRIVDRAKLEAHIERAKMVLDTRNEVVHLTFDAVRRVLDEKVDAAAQDALLDRFFEELDELKV
jgi:F-type H+-transporting ATPase subunit b